MAIGYIYRIQHKVLNLYYYGSTQGTLEWRWVKHMDTYKYKGNSVSICKYFDLFHVEDFYIHFVDLVKFENKDELLIREQWYIDNFECVNERNAWGRNLEREKKYKKDYNQCPENKEKRRQYENTPERKKYQKQYKKSEKHKKQQKDYHGEKIECVCGLILNKSSIANHRKTKKHATLMNKK